jgi:hypothetical protein
MIQKDLNVQQIAGAPGTLGPYAPFHLLALEAPSRTLANLRCGRCSLERGRLLPWVKPRTLRPVQVLRRYMSVCGEQNGLMLCACSSS